jgi:hypothetical protein
MVGNGSQFNGIPMTVAASEPPVVGERWTVSTIRMEGRHIDDEVGELEDWQSLYVSTKVVKVEQLTFDMLDIWRPAA